MTEFGTRDPKKAELEMLPLSGNSPGLRFGCCILGAAPNIPMLRGVGRFPGQSCTPGTSSTRGAGDTEPLHQAHQTIMSIVPKYPCGGWHEAHAHPAGCSPPPGAAEGPGSQHRGEMLWVQLLPNAERCPPHPAVARRTSHTY